tara:strand:+ start:129 stop:347 length:219 start_codon:yes stop_codon:yes gene_type:complete
MIYENITKFEKVRVISERANQISEGAPILVDYEGLTNSLDIATKEFNERKIPLIIKRTLPNGNIQNIKIFIK